VEKLERIPKLENVTRGMKGMLSSLIYLVETLWQRILRGIPSVIQRYNYIPLTPAVSVMLKHEIVNLREL
jgi:hypothetical protein